MNMLHYIMLPPFRDLDLANYKTRVWLSPPIYDGVYIVLQATGDLLWKFRLQWLSTSTEAS